MHVGTSSAARSICHSFLRREDSPFMSSIIVAAFMARALVGVGGGGVDVFEMRRDNKRLFADLRPGT